MILEELRSHVLEVANLLPKYGLVWMAGGTVCAREPQTGYVVVTPSGLDYSRLTPADMIVTDVDMNLVEGKKRVFTILIPVPKPNSRSKTSIDTSSSSVL